MEEGEGDGSEIRVETSSMSRVSFGKEPRVVKVRVPLLQEKKVPKICRLFRKAPQTKKKKDISKIAEVRY